MMKNLMLRTYLNGVNKASYVKKSMKNFISDERGMSEAVAATLLVLIVVLLAVFFWDQLSTWIQDLWQQIMGESKGIKGIV